MLPRNCSRCLLNDSESRHSARGCLVRVHAGRRLTDGSGRNRTRPTPKAPLQPRKPTAPATTNSESKEPEPIEVPSIGWMWQVGRKGDNVSSDDNSRPMPTARSTVANLYEDRIKAKKSLGQNFLTDDGVLRDIVAAAGVAPGDLVLEVGPGTGNLTKHLMTRGAVVTAVEKDDTLYGRLREEYRTEIDRKQLMLVHGDAVQVGLEEVIRGMLGQGRQQQQQGEEEEQQQQLQQQQQQEEATTGGTAAIASSSPVPSPPVLSEASSGVAGSSSSTVVGDAGSSAGSRQDVASSSSSSSGRSSSSSSGKLSSLSTSVGPPTSNRKVKVVANLPYNITKDLLLLLLPLGDLVSELHIMIQHEAAVRLTERNPGGPEWRAANLRTLFYSKPSYRFRISRLLYDPVPGVDGALVTFALVPPARRPHVPSERGFHVLVAKAFSERRKKMRNSLQPLHSPEQVEAALSACGLSADARAQDLTLPQFVDLAWQLHRAQVGELEL
ncbi:hypothetical protein Agub_g11037 [Astrephomene gubernaculifera]|uniref:rRNA adenine N(6)-methyltransferase n=1 Tax=Astrephomene gubernaculifera TaxID=47775 RepID=A0AAD3DVY3_9CHLO|nr:hypothetical protein Agub_g11037 [Astrephomene gubernaculifera]